MTPLVSATARDRDKIRERVLRGLGWEIARIWSTDWWHDAAGALDKVHTELERLLEQQRAKHLEIHKIENPAVDKTNEPQTISPVQQEDLVEEEPLKVASAVYARNCYVRDSASSEQEQKSDQAMFYEADPASVVTDINPDAFFNTEYDATLQTMIAHVIEIEGPVREDVLAKRIARTHGWARTGKRIRDRVFHIAEKKYPITTEEVGRFFWPVGSDTNEWAVFRYSENGCRSVDEMAMPELKSLAKDVVRECKSVDDSVAEIARSIGIRRVTEEVRRRLEDCVVTGGDER